MTKLLIGCVIGRSLFSTVTTACLALLLAIQLSQTCAAQFRFQQQPRNEEAYEEVFLLAPRPLVRLLREGEAALEDGRYTDGILALGALLQDDASNLAEDLQGQDFFLEAGRNRLYNKTIKGEARRLFRQLSEPGRKVLEIEFGVQARRELAKALLERDVAGVADVARKFSHTEAGYDAELIVARTKLANGFPTAAARSFQSLLDSPAARSRYGVELVKATAVSWGHADKVENAVQTLTNAARYFPDSSIELGGRQYLLNANEDWKSVLANTLEFQQSRIGDRTAENWLVAGGSPSRNATVKASMPLRNSRWVKEIHSSVPEKNSLREVEEAEFQGERTILPQFEVRMLGDLLLTKTSDSEVLAVDFETGLTKWPFYYNSSPAKLMSLQFESSRRGGSSSGLSDELVNRVWGSAAFGRFSCDQERLYYISDEQVPSAGLRRGIPRVETNLLQGVSIQSQGKIEWQVGGSTDNSSEPRLQGAYFLGPPLSYDGDLFAIIEQKGETRLVALDPASGDLRWSQQLAHPMRSPIKNDPSRRSQAVSPTISDGVILCPTGAGAVIAVDLLTRRLLWGYSYTPQLRQSINQFRRGGGAFSFDSMTYKPLDARWQDNAMIAQDGIVIISAAESDTYFGLRVDTGEQVLSPKPRGNSRYIAGIRGDNLYIVAEREAFCLNMKESDIRWMRPFPERRKLAGKGLWLEDSLMVPLTGNKLLRINLDDGDVLSEATVDQSLGNLFVHRGNLISASSTNVAAYYMRYDLEKEVTRRLANDASDTWAINQQAQLALATSNIDQAYQLLSKSYHIDTENIDTRYLLIETLLAGMEQDFERYEERANQIKNVVEYGPQRFRFLQWLALGSLRAGKPMEAFENFMALMRERVGVIRSSINSRASSLRMNELYSVDVDNWIATELARLYQSVGEQQKAQMDRAVTKELDGLSDLVAGRRRQTLQYFRWHPSASDELLDTAIALLEREDQTRAERLLVPFLESEDARTRDVAAKLLAKRNIQDNLRFGPRGQAFHSTNQPLGNQQGLEAFLRQQSDSDEFMKPVTWNRGLLTARVRQDGPRLYPQGLRLPMISERFGRPVFDVKLAGGMLIVMNMNGEDIARFEFNRASSDINDEYAKAHVRGGLVIVETSSEVVVMDLYRGLSDGRDAMLWRQSLLYPIASPGSSFRPASKPPPRSESPLGVPIALRKSGNRKTAVGPLTPAGLVLQLANSIVLIDAYTGRQLWERNGYDDNVRLAASGMQVAVVNPSMGEVELLDCRDGAILDKHEYRGDWEPWFSYNDVMVDYSTKQPQNLGNAAIKSQNTKHPVLRIWNPLTGADLIPPLYLARGSKANICEGRFLVVLEPDSKLHYFDLKQKSYVELEAAVDSQLEAVHLERFGDMLVVLSEADDVVGRRSANEPVLLKAVNGYVHAIDIESQQLVWERPGKLKQMQFPDSQPRNSPFMVVYRQNSIRGSRTPRNEMVAEALAVVDLRSGYLAYSTEDIPLGRTSGFRMMLYPRSQSFEFFLGNRNFFLTATEGGRPPQPIFSYGHHNKTRTVDRSNRLNILGN